MRSIWENEFYNTKPALAWTFKFNFNEYIKIVDNIPFKSNENPIAEFSNEYRINLRKILKSKMTEWKHNMEILNKAAVNISVGERKTNTFNLFYGGLSYTKLSHVDNAGSFTITFNENKNYDVTKVLENIYSYSNDRDYFKDGVIYNNSFDKTYFSSNHIISVRMLNSNFLDDVTVKELNTHRLGEMAEGNIKECKFINCKLIGLEPFTLSYESTDTIVRNATFVYDWLYFNTIIDEEIK